MADRLIKLKRLYLNTAAGLFLNLMDISLKFMNLPLKLAHLFIKLIEMFLKLQI
jgi:hypothetical protein